MMQIGELADRAGLSLRTIRHWEEEGLIVPSARSVGGFRLYSGEDFERLLLIRRMKPLGFSIEEMRELLATIDALDADADHPDHPARARLAGFVAQALERREKLRTQLDMADEFVERLRGI
nr:MerR family transcriptional regulator [Nakamurella flavida]